MMCNKALMYKSWLAVFVLALLFSSCSNTKYLASGEELYTGAHLQFDKESRQRLEKEALASMESALAPKPNKKFLGMRFKLSVYNHTKEPGKKTGFKYWLKYKVGEPPVLLGQVDPDRSSRLLENRLSTFGHFRSD